MKSVSIEDTCLRIFDAHTHSLIMHYVSNVLVVVSFSALCDAQYCLTYVVVCQIMITHIGTTVTNMSNMYMVFDSCFLTEILHL